MVDVLEKHSPHSLFVSQKTKQPHCHQVTWKEAVAKNAKYYRGKSCDACENNIRQVGYGDVYTNHQRGQCYTCKLFRDGLRRANINIKDLSPQEQTNIRAIDGAAANLTSDGFIVNVHHIVPLGAGGKHAADNLAIVTTTGHKKIHATIRSWKKWVVICQNHIKKNPHTICPI